MNADKHGPMSFLLLEVAAWLAAVAELGGGRVSSDGTTPNASDKCHVRFCMSPHEEAWRQAAARISAPSISVIAVCPLVPQGLASQRSEPRSPP